MGISDAQPMDIYVDKQGKLWRCVGTCSEPTAIFEEVEGHTKASGGVNMGAAVLFNGQPPQPASEIIKTRVSGGVTGMMWDGWQRIWRKE